MLDKIDVNSDLHKEFTLNSFLTNPTGDVGHSVGQRKLVIDNIRQRMVGLMNAKRKFSHTYYMIGQDLYIKVNVPSETFDNFHYEVLVKFIEPNMKATSIIDSHIELFSNSPSFVYSYAYVFNFFNIFIKELSKKMDKKALEELSAVRNPDAVVFYEKTITMALIYIKEQQLCNTHSIKPSMLKLPLSKFKEIACESSEKKQIEYNALKVKEAARKKLEKKAKLAADDAAKKKRAQEKVLADIESGLKPNQTRNKANNRVNSKILPVKKKLNNKVNNRVNNKVK